MKRFASMCAVALSLGAGLAVTSPAAAGTSGGIRVNYQVFGGDDPATVGDALDLELFVEPATVGGSGTLVPGCSVGGSGASRTCLYTPGVLTPGVSYIIGVGGIDDAYEVSSVSCSNLGGPAEMLDTTDFPNAVIPYDDFDRWECTVEITAKPMLYIDKLITASGGASSTDFTLELYDDTGTLVPITPAIVDPDDAQCSFGATIDDATCAAVPLSAGDYTIGEILPGYGYDAGLFVCESSIDFVDAREILPTPAYDFTHSGPDRDDTLCTLTNDYLTQTVSADIEVTNDGGRTATGADFTIEVFNSSGILVASGVDPEPGTGNASAEFVLPIGDYTFGVDGPEGYDASATVTVSATNTETEIIGTGADFTLTRDQTAIGVISVDDQTIPTTTTTTTTIVPETTTTTAVATTTTLMAVAPITTLTGLLPATGTDAWRKLPLMLLALALMALGGGAILTTRRS